MSYIVPAGCVGQWPDVTFVPVLKKIADCGETTALDGLARFRASYAAVGSCWEWSGHRRSRGRGKPPAYGIFCFAARQFRAHRVAWQLANLAESIPAGLVVCHRCDNPACVFPGHLSLGTQAENLADMRAKGRASFPPTLTGERHPRARLSDSQVAEIRTSYCAGIRPVDLANRFGVSATCVIDIGKGRVRKDEGSER